MTRIPVAVATFAFLCAPIAFAQPMRRASTESGSVASASELYEVTPHAEPLFPESRTRLVSIAGSATASHRFVAAVRGILRSNIVSVQSCHARQLRINPALAGSMHIRLTVGVSGRAVACEVSEAPDPAIESCVCARLRSFVFPPAEAGRESIDIVVRMDPGPMPQGPPLRPGCGTIHSMPGPVRTLARAIIGLHCLGARGSIAFRNGALELWLDGESQSPVNFLDAGGRAAFRAAGVARIQVIPSGGPAGEYRVLPVRVLTL